MEPWLGDALADGSKKAAAVIGKGSKAYSIQFGGQEPGMHDPGYDPYFAANYAYNPTPGKHTSGADTYMGSFSWETWLVFAVWQLPLAVSEPLIFLRSLTMVQDGRRQQMNIWKSDTLHKEYKRPGSSER